MQSEQAHLFLIQNGEQKDLYSLSGIPVATMGRAAENTFSFLDDRCSRYHAKIFYDNGQWYVQDLNSRNGTYLDGKLIDAKLPVALESDVHIQIGHTLLLFGCGEPGTATTEISNPNNDGAPASQQHSGIVGILKDSLRGPTSESAFSSKILHRKEHPEILRPDVNSRQGAAMLTRTGFGAVELCRLAYHLGKADEIDKVAKLAIEGLLNATGAEGAGLWLFPYNLHSPQQAADIRLVANATLENHQYNPISEALVRTVFEKHEAFLFHDTKIGTKIGKMPRPQKSHTTTRRRLSDRQSDWQAQVGNNILAAPIRFQNGILGLLHLYTVTETKYFDEADLEYTLAVADTVGVALAHVNKQKELAANLNQARKENSTLREMLRMNSEIIGESESMKQIHHLISRAAEAKTSLLIRGESGVGKELIARAVHFASARKSKPLVCLNCAAVSESLLASELFGHEKGAFTGATERKIGKFEAANTGTLFLDEIGEMSPSLQAKLLRVLEGSSFERVGGNVPIKVDVRVLAATNRNLEKEVAEGRFRHDLFFRLRVLEIVVPPLRKRIDDIPILADYFLNTYCKETGRKCQGFDAEAMRVLMNYRWPGNIRELKNVIERAVVLGPDSTIHEQDLLLSTLNTMGESGIRFDGRDHRPQEVFVPLSLEDMEKSHIIRTLVHVHWNKSLASKQLGIERTTLDRKIKRYGLERDESEV